MIRRNVPPAVAAPQEYYNPWDAVFQYDSVAPDSKRQSYASKSIAWPALLPDGDESAHLSVLLPNCTNQAGRIVTTPHQTRALNGRNSMLLCRRNLDFSAAQSSVFLSGRERVQGDVVIVCPPRISGTPCQLRGQGGNTGRRFDALSLASQEHPNINFRDTTPIKPAANQVLCPRNANYKGLLQLER